VTTEQCGARVRRGDRSLGNRRLNDLRCTPDDDNAVRSQRGHNSDITRAGLRDVTRPRLAPPQTGRSTAPAIKHSPADKELPKLDSFMAGSAAVERPLAVRELRSRRNHRRVAPMREVLSACRKVENNVTYVPRRLWTEGWL